MKGSGKGGKGNGGKGGSGKSAGKLGGSSAATTPTKAPKHAGLPGNPKKADEEMAHLRAKLSELQKAALDPQVSKEELAARCAPPPPLKLPINSAVEAAQKVKKIENTLAQKATKVQRQKAELDATYAEYRSLEAELAEAKKAHDELLETLRKEPPAPVAEQHDDLDALVAKLRGRSLESRKEFVLRLQQSLLETPNEAKKARTDQPDCSTEPTEVNVQVSQQSMAPSVGSTSGPVSVSTVPATPPLEAPDNVKSGADSVGAVPGVPALPAIPASPSASNVENADVDMEAADSKSRKRPASEIDHLSIQKSINDANELLTGATQEGFLTPCG